MGRPSEASPNQASPRHFNGCCAKWQPLKSVTRECEPTAFSVSAEGPQRRMNQASLSTLQHFRYLIPDSRPRAWLTLPHLADAGRDSSAISDVSKQALSVSSLVEIGRSCFLSFSICFTFGSMSQLCIVSSRSGSGESLWDQHDLHCWAIY
jgi:hypothetical protein